MGQAAGKGRHREQQACFRGLPPRPETGVVYIADRVDPSILLRFHGLSVVVGSVATEGLALYGRLRDGDGVQRAQVVSAVPLTPDEIARVHAQLEKWTGLKIVLTSEVDPALVGGAYARVGDRIVDRSVKSLLEAVAHQLYEVSV